MNTLAETSEPLAYLLSSYDRCQKEFDRGATGDLEQHLVSLNTLIVSYVGLLLCIPGMFPQSEEQEKRGVLQLYDALVADKVRARGPGIFPFPLAGDLTSHPFPFRVLSV